ncbi:CHAT domain-containing protein [Micromonospora sp. WMMD987]|uniref:CHAT domain-containing protein n=1 Tax=Micromonospora sp. WMMD987 TaxID=3016089 RepID=UPI00249A9686|nr:CHAT domain-containing protein [Micromonospora sp. WMMD987]WFE97523.1 CHAT domain-containing protein [Micromonospora sp. WMMD987]
MRITFLEEHLEARHEAVYAVCALMHVSGRAEMAEVLQAELALRTPAALAFVDELIGDVAASGLSRGHLEALRNVLSQLSPREEPGERAAPAGQAGIDGLADARALIHQDRVEEAESVLVRAAEASREAGDLRSEGRAEGMLCDLILRTVWPAPGSLERLAYHADRAVHALSRARDDVGLAAALRRLLVAALGLGDGPLLTDTLGRLGVVDPRGLPWWHTYVLAVQSDDPTFTRVQLEWCLNNMAKLGSDAVTWLPLCEHRLAVATGYTGDLSALPPTVAGEPPSPAVRERLEPLAARAERMRATTSSATIHRGLSAVYTPVYEALARCVAGAEAIDILERNASRSLLAAATPASDGTLDDLVRLFAARPTDANRRLLTVGLKRHRDRERIAAQRVRATGESPSPVTVQKLRELLDGSDAVLVRDRWIIDRNGVTEEPVDARVAPDARLFVVPAAGAWAEPVDATLTARYRVGLVPSLSILARVLESPARPASTLLAFADPDGSLPYAHHEGTAIARNYTESRVHTGAEATPDRYREEASGADVVHLACHGFYLPENPDYSGLRLADGALLWYADVRRIALSAALVVLGACHAGTGEVLSGSEYVGLPGAFLAAGARTVVAPLRKVDDAVTADLMDHFHRHHAATGQPAESLRRATAAVGTGDTVTAFQVFGAP